MFGFVEDDIENAIYLDGIMFGIIITGLSYF